MRSYYEAYQAADGWRWRLKAGNHEIVASGEAYARKADCGRSIASHRRHAATAEEAVRWPDGVVPPKLRWWRRWGRAS